MLKIVNLLKSFGEHKVLQGLDMSIDEGKIYTIVGGNGTGKTTLFNLITGFEKSDDGEILFKDHTLENHSPVSINSMGISRTFQDLRLIKQFSLKENILLSFKGNPGDKFIKSLLPSCTFDSQNNEFSLRANEILNDIHLMQMEETLAGKISPGQQKLLTIGCCLANDAQLLLLDEPVAGIDEDNSKLISDLIIKLKSKGRTILQIEHNHKYIESISDGIWFLNEGKATLFDSFNTFINDPYVKDNY